MDIARTQNYLIIFVLLARKHGIISYTKPVIQGCIFNGIHSDWIGELQKDDFEKLKNLTDQLIQQEGSEEKALASLDDRLENGYRSRLKAIEIRFHELLKERIGFLLVNSSNWVGGIAPQIGLNLTSLALIDVNSGWSALPFTSLSWTITDKDGIVTLSYRDNCRMADGWGRGFDITGDNTKLTYEESVQPYDSNPISAEKESQIANTTKWGNRPIGLILSLFGIFILFGTLGVPLYLAYSGEKEIQLFVIFNLMGGSLFLLGLNLLLFGNYKWFPKNSGQENIGNLHWQQALQQVWFRFITLQWQVWCLIYANIFIAAIAFVYIQGVFESFGFEGLKQENQPKAEIITKAIAEAKTNEIPLTGEQKADLEKALTLNNQLNTLLSQGKYAESTPLAIEALKIRRDVLGNKHPDTARSIHNLALIYFKQAQYATAEPLNLEALKICREVLGDNHPDTAHSINNLAGLYNVQAQYAKAEPLYLEALKIRREVLGNKHPDTAGSINNLALLYYNQAQYAKAEPLYLEALKIQREVLGDKHPDTALTIINLGNVYARQAQYAKAELLYLEALNINREVLGYKHPDTATSINNLALLYEAQGQYAKAEPLYLEALKIFREVSGDKHPATANSIINLGNVYVRQAQYAKAEPLYLEAFKIRREVLGNKHPATAISINNLALLYFNQGLRVKALLLYLEALKIQREVLGSKHPDTAGSINNLALLYYNQAQYAKAEPLLIEAIKINREALGDKQPETANSINNLANLYQAQAQYAKAEPLYLEALKIYREVLGDKHPETAMSLNNLALLYFAQAQYAKAEPLYLEALKILTAHLQATSIIQSENAQILMTNNYKQRLNNFLTNALANHTPGGGYDQVLSWKGMIYRRQNLLRALEGNDPLKKELSDTIRQLATLLNSTPKPGEVDQFEAKIKALSEKKDELEKELAKQIPSLNLAKVTPSELQNLIAPDVALIDIFQYSHFSAPKEGQAILVFEQRYAAWVIRKDKPIIRLELGSAEGLNNLVLQWRSSLSTRKSPSEGPQDPALALRGKVWLPIAKHLDGAKTVIISPDGMLGTLPFTALPGEDIKKYLIEERNIAVVPFLQTLPDLLAKKELAGKNLLAVGDIAYDAEPGSGSLLAKTALRSKNTLKWNALDGTRAEMVAIRDSFEQKFPDAKSMQLRKAQATEEAFRQQAPKANFLHIATHGFFVEAAPLTTDSKNSAKIDNPGLQSGLVLAGANQPIQSGLDDGILTASEVAELDLTGVEQAVLSACETGLGKSLAGEGLLGLQRAFQLAGARTVVASMWKVPDLATKELMTRYYENIWEKKMGKLEALREAQLWMLKEGKKRGIDAETVDTKDAPKPAVVETGNRMPPLYWGAWVLSGAWN